MTRTFLVGLGLGALLVGVAAIGTAWSGPQHLLAQDQPTEGAQPPTITVDANLRALAVLDSLPSAPAQLSVVELTIAPGATVQSFTTPGPTLLVVQNQAEVVLDASEATIDDGPQVAALVGMRSQPSSSAPISVVLGNNQQALLPAGAQAQLHNTGDDDARLLLIVLAPATAGTPGGTPAA